MPATMTMDRSGNIAMFPPAAQPKGKPVLVQIAVGVWIDPISRRDINPHSRWLLLDERGIASLGMTPHQACTLLRLGEAKFVRIAEITPKLRLLDIDSWDRHIATVTSDDLFWLRPENRARWQRVTGRGKGNV